MAERSSDVYLRLITQWRKEALDDAIKELRAIRAEVKGFREESRAAAKSTGTDFERVARAAGRATLSIAGFKKGTELLAKAIRIGLVGAIVAVLRKMKDFALGLVPFRAAIGRVAELAKAALSAVNPVRKLADAWGNFLRTIRRIAFRFIIYKTLRQITQLAQGIVTALLETAPAFEEIQRGFYNLASAAGISGRELMESMAKAAAGTLPMIDMMQKASYAVLTYGRDITQYLPELIAGARRASKALGIDMADAYTRLIDGIARTSKRMLSGVGIVFSSAAAYETYATQIGKVAGDLTDTEKKAAYLQATLGFLRTQAKALGETTFTARDAMAAFRASLSDTVVTSLQVFLPVLKRVFWGLLGVVEALDTPFRTAVAGAAIVLDNLLTIVKGLVQAITRTRTFQILRDWAVGIGQALGYFVNQMSVQMPQIIQSLDDLVQRLLGGERGFERLKDAAMTSLSVMRSVFQAILAAMTGDWDAFWYHLGEGAKTGLTFVLITVGNWAQTIFARFDEMTGGFLSWGANLVFYFAKGFIQGAGSFLVTALNFVGGVIKAFLGAFSPPKKGPLRDIVKWGLGLIESYFYGMTLASFDLFEQAIRPIEQRLQSLMDWGDIDETRFAEVMTLARELLAEYALELQQTGIVNEDVLGRLSELMQGAGDDVVRYIRVLGRLIQAQTAMDDVQEEYNKEAEKGFVTEAMATKMREARLRLRAAQKEERWDRAFVSQRQTGIDIWIRQEKLLKSMADTVSDLFEEMNFGISELDLNLGNALDSFKDMFAGFELPALEFSEMFQEMRAEVNWFMRGLAGEVFPTGLPEGAPAAFVRGAELRKSLDTLRTSIGGLKETWAPLVEEVTKFFKAFSDEDVERMGTLAGWLLSWAATTEPIRNLFAGLVEGLGKGVIALALLKTLGLLPLLLPLALVTLGILAIAGGSALLHEKVTGTWPSMKTIILDTLSAVIPPLETLRNLIDTIRSGLEWLSAHQGVSAGGAVGMPGGTQPGAPSRPTIGLIEDPRSLLDRARSIFTPAPVRPRGLQQFQHGGFIPRTGLYGLHKDELVLNEGQWKGMLGALGSRGLPADMAMGGGGGADAPLIHMENVYVRNEQDIEKLAARISFLIGQNANRRARLGA